MHSRDWIIIAIVLCVLYVYLVYTLVSEFKNEPIFQPEDMTASKFITRCNELHGQEWKIHKTTQYISYDNSFWLESPFIRFYDKNNNYVEYTCRPL